MNELILSDQNLPTPFSAAQIRSDCPEGHTVDTELVRKGKVKGRERRVFSQVDAEGCVIATSDLDKRGQPRGKVFYSEYTWRELQEHASFPKSSATRARDTIASPLGTLECWRYELAENAITMVFWFADSHPGMPVRFGPRAPGGDFVEIVDVVAISVT